MLCVLEILNHKMIDDQLSSSHVFIQAHNVVIYLCDCINDCGYNANS